MKNTKHILLFFCFTRVDIVLKYVVNEAWVFAHVNCFFIKETRGGIKSMRIKKVIVFEKEVILVLDNRKQDILRLKPYVIVGHGRGIHVPKRENSYLTDIRDRNGDVDYQKIEYIIKKRVRQFSLHKTVVYEHDPHIGYHGLYFEFPKSAAKYRLEIDNTEFVFNIF